MALLATVHLLHTYFYINFLHNHHLIWDILVDIAIGQFFLMPMLKPTTYHIAPSLIGHHVTDNITFLVLACIIFLLLPSSL